MIGSEGEDACEKLARVLDHDIRQCTQRLGVSEVGGHIMITPCKLLEHKCSC